LDRLISEAIADRLGDCPWREHLIILDTVDSTNTYCKKLAAEGAPHGTVVMAESQTAGRGRMGRSFASPEGAGLYLSVILRPNASPGELMHLTAMAAEAAVRAVEDAAGLRPGIKWTNDLVVGKRKLAGILTEVGIEQNGVIDYVVVGIGINCSNTEADFPEDVRHMATSLLLETGKRVSRNVCAAALIRWLWKADFEMLEGKQAWLADYAADCITIGQDVKIVRGGNERLAHAEGIDEDAALIVTYRDGTREAVSSGEVSVRGMYGYV